MISIDRGLIKVKGEKATIIAEAVVALLHYAKETMDEDECRNSLNKAEKSEEQLKSEVVEKIERLLNSLKERE